MTEYVILGWNCMDGTWQRVVIFWQRRWRLQAFELAPPGFVRLCISELSVISCLGLERSISENTIFWLLRWTF
jgi:hypothetical protein